jgi:hypothetical protein
MLGKVAARDIWMTLLGRVGSIAAFVIPITIVVPATAATITGVAVSSVGSSTVVGSTDNVLPLGGDSIRYFIPLGDNNGTYGVGSSCNHHGFGTCADTGNGGGTLSMVLRFSPITTTIPSWLTIKFEDLDLRGANDPNGFFESLNIFRAGKSITGGWITDISSSLFTADSNHDLQTLRLLLSAPINGPLYLVLKFKATSDFDGINTPEYLRATIDVADQTPPIPTPLPGTLLLMGSVLTSSYGARIWRRRRQPAA